MELKYKLKEHWLTIYNIARTCHNIKAGVRVLGISVNLTAFTFTLETHVFCPHITVFLKDLNLSFNVIGRLQAQIIRC